VTPDRAGRLTAALIVRDESRYLPGCLESLTIADEIVVVDTGSTDDTIDIARRFGATILHHEWAGDFAAPRNRGLDAATGAWILYIDADERLRVPDGAQVKCLLDDPRHVACTVRYLPRTGFTRYHEHRLFRNDPRIRFHGRIHESFLGDMAAIIDTDDRSVAVSTVEIDHLGYDGDLSRKHARNLPLLRARLEETPNHVYSWDHLGRTLAAMGQPEEARAAWRTGIEIARRRGWADVLDSLPYADLLRELSPSADGYAELLAEALEHFPDDHMLRWIEGRALMSAGRFEEARPLFERLITVDPDTYCHARIGYDRRIFRVLAYDSLGVIHFRLGQPAESRLYFELASAADPAEPAHHVRRLLMESRMQAAATGSWR
jgi:tetratricopeptide (TPR) repeat protein